MNWVFGVLLLFCSFWAPAEASDSFYVSDVLSEREQQHVEVFLFKALKPQDRPLSEVIFNVELSKEFKLKYREKFGEVDTDSLAYRPYDFTRIDSFKGNSRDVEDENLRRRLFAEYMARRLTEWHVDNYLKNEPQMRPVLEAKERLQRVEVKVGEKSRLEGKYALAGNTLDVILWNPYLESKWVIEMNPGAWGPTKSQNNKIILGKQLDPQQKLVSTSTEKEGRSTIEWRKHQTRNWIWTSSVSAAFRSSPWSGETRIAGGFLWLL